MAPLTELKAVNLILKAIDEPPVSSLLLTGLLPLERARSALEEASLSVQTTGWTFNTEYEYPLVRQIDTSITLPENTIRVDVDDNHTQVDPVLRGIRLYDRKNHTYLFDKDLTGTVVLALDWDELPQPARHYIALHAAGALQGPMSVAPELVKGIQEERQAAWLGLQQSESEEADCNMLRDSSSVLNVLEGGGW